MAVMNLVKLSGIKERILVTHSIKVTSVVLSIITIDDDVETK